MGVSASSACDNRCLRPSDLGADAEGSEIRSDSRSSAIGRKALLTPLCKAASKGDLATVKSLVRSGHRVSSVSSDGKGPLHMAALNGHEEVVAFLLEKGAPKDALDVRGRPAILLAAEKGHTGIVFMLLEKGCEKKTIQGRLRDAAKKDQTDMVKRMIECKAKIDCRSKEGRTALHHAAYYGHFETAKALLDMGASKDIECKANTTPLTSAAKHGHIAIMQLLLDKGARMHNRERKLLGQKLIKCAMVGDLELTRTLLIFEASLLETKDGMSAVMASVTSGNYEIARLLMEKHPCERDVVYVGKALLQACEDGDREQAESLLDLGADVSACDCFCETALWKASANGHLDVVRKLLEKGSHIESRSMNCNRTPVVVAADRGHQTVVKYLLSKRAQTPSSLDLGRKFREASERGDVGRLQCLVQLGGKSDCVNPDGESPLHLAAAKGHLPVVKLLLSQKAKVDTKGGTPPRTALCYAVEHRQMAILQVLLDANSVEEESRDKEAVEQAHALLADRN